MATAGTEIEDEVVQTARRKHPNLARSDIGRADPQRDRGRVNLWIEVTSWHSRVVIESWTGGR